MNFKKLFCGTLTVALMGAMLMGCGGGSSETGSTTTAATTTAATTAAATAAPTDATAAGGDSAASGEVYTNNALGLKYTAPDGVTVAVQGEGSQYEMMATSSSGETLIVMNQEGANVSEEAFAELLKTRLSSQLTNPTFKDLKKTTVGGVEFTDLTYNFTSSGVNASQVMLLKSEGNNIIVVTVTYLNESGREKLLSGFSAL